MYIFFVLAIITIVCLIFINLPTPSPIFSIYRQPDKWYLIKISIFYAVLKLREFYEKLKNDDNEDSGRGGKKHRIYIEKLECSRQLLYNPQDFNQLIQDFGLHYISFSGSIHYDLTDTNAKNLTKIHQKISLSNLLAHPRIYTFAPIVHQYGLSVVTNLAIDSVHFMASDKKENFLATAIGRRYNGIVDGFIYLNIPEIGLLESLKLPDTILLQEDKEKSQRLFSAEGLCYTPLRPLKRWKISYDGKMRVAGNSKEVVHVCLDAMWTSNLRSFDTDMDMDPVLLAKIFAREPWNEEYFDILKNFRLTHYEQHGNIYGTAMVNGEIFQLKMNSVKSRNYGIMEWKHFHRYVTHYMHFQDGTSITVGTISIPVIFSSKEYGYVSKPNGSVFPITFSSLKLHEHGEGGTPPKDYSFSIKAGGRTYHIQVEILKSAEFYAGWQWEARFVECMAKFTFNGNIGWGGVEWHYSHHGQRPLSISSKDPEWTKKKNESHVFSLNRKLEYGPVILPFQINKI